MLMPNTARTNPSRSSARTESSWFTTAPALPAFQPLKEDLTAEVVVVGGGIAGLTTAYLLSKEGRDVVLLEDGELASGESGRTTAHLSNALDEHYFNLESIFGKEGARLAAESHSAAIDRIEQIIKDENIACDFARVDGYLFLHEEGNARDLKKELEAAHRAGLREVEYLAEADNVGFRTGECLRFPRQGQFHILKYLRGLAQAITKHGGRIFTHTHVTDVKGGDQAQVETTDGRVVRASAGIVVATNSPFNDRVVMHTKQSTYRTYVLGARVPKGSVAGALFWDTGDPYHYVRVQEVGAGPRGGKPDYDLLLVGGEDHKVGQEDHPERAFERLETWTRERFPYLTGIEFRWSGQVLESNDSLGFIGRNPLDSDNVFIITGDSGHGMTHGTIGGMLLTDLILDRQNPWARLYEPGRITLSLDTVKEFIKENINVASEYAELLTGGDVAEEAQIRPGEGAVLRRGLTKVAVYKDEAGATHACSAICPHLGCVVHWNGLEKSWDCPCHGSRFDAFGALLMGPANSDLAPVGEV